MTSSIYQSLFSTGKKIFALLIDPENQSEEVLPRILEEASQARVDMVLVGGSLISTPIDDTIYRIRKQVTCPVVLFPGNLLQLSGKADGILLLSLLSGRNPEYLIGNQVLASLYLKKSGLEIIPTGYLLIDGHRLSSVEYISNTRPLPQDKPELIVATALAGEQLGLKLIYLEAGSGALERISDEIVQRVKQIINIPLIVGGGIRTPEDIRKLYQAGADGVVVGSAVEEDMARLQPLARIRKEFLPKV